MQISHKAIIGIGISIAIGSMLADAYAGAPTFRWVQQAGGTNVDYSTGVAADALGNTFVLGRFTSSDATFGGIAFSNGPVFLAKLNANGDVIWAKGLSSDLWQFLAPRSYRFAADGLGGVLIGGSFNSSSITIDGVTLTRSSSPGYSAAFIARFDGSGNLAMARIAAGGTNNDNITTDAVASDGAGNVFLTGRYLTALDLGLTNTGGGFYAAEFNTNGNLVWAKSISPTPGGLTQPLAIVPLANSNLFVGGWFTTPTVTFDNITLTNTSSLSLFLVKYDSGRNVMWAKSGALTTPLVGLSFALHGDGAGNSYVFGNTGANNGSASISIGGCTLTHTQDFRFIFKIAPDGQVLWCRKAGDFINEQYPFLRGVATDCDVDALGNCYVVGEFYGLASFGGITFTNVGGTGAGLGDYPSYFLAKLNPEGSYVWAKAFGADDTHDYGEPYYDYPTIRVAADVQGNCSFAASFTRTNCPFDSLTLASFGKRDAFVARIEADPPRLDIFQVGDSVALAWPTNQPGFVLECVDVLPATNGWTTITNAVTGVGAQHFVTNPISAGSQFYRLRRL